MQHLLPQSEGPPGTFSLPDSEDDCVNRARQGDSAAFTELFHRYNAPLCTYLSNLVGNSDVGRDLAQETFIHAWKGLPGLTDELRFKAWFYRIATNIARSHLRHERIIRWLPWGESLQGRETEFLHMDGPERQTEEMERIRQVLDKLGSRVRTCLLLQLYVGFSQREIATILSISEKSVSAYVSRGREQFRHLYSEGKGDSSL
jgi:RNA polymerase sigma-70 factor, ECF subfamily